MFELMLGPRLSGAGGGRNRTDPGKLEAVLVLSTSPEDPCAGSFGARCGGALQVHCVQKKAPCLLLQSSWIVGTAICHCRKEFQYFMKKAF